MSINRLPDSALYLAAAREVVGAFPIEAVQVVPLALGENAVFRVLGQAGGADHVLRLHRPGYNTLQELNSERAWTSALNAAGVSAPQGVRARDGRWFVPVRTPDPAGVRLAGLAAWCNGEVLSDVLAGEGAGPTADHYARLGAFVARLHNHATDWKQPPGFARRALDADALVGTSPFWGPFWESASLTPDERRIATAARDRLFTHLSHMTKSPETFGLIHADLHPGNVLQNGSQLSAIDFDDAAFGWYAFDIAAAVFAAWSRPNYPELHAAFLSGYAQERPLFAGIEEAIEIFLLTRGLMLFGWHDQRPELDPAPYLAAWKARLLRASVMYLTA